MFCLKLSDANDPQGLSTKQTNKQTNGVYINNVKVRKKARVSNRYNQVSTLSTDTTWENYEITINATGKSQEASHFPSGDHEAVMNRHESITNTIHKIYTSSTKEVPPWNSQ